MVTCSWFSSPALFFSTVPSVLFAHWILSVWIHASGVFPKGHVFIVLNTAYAVPSFSWIICPCCVCVRACVLAGWGTCSDTSAVCRVARPWRSGWSFRLPAVHHLYQGEEERWRATNGSLQVTHTHTHIEIHTVWINTVSMFNLPLLYILCLNYLPVLGLDGQVF